LLVLMTGIIGLAFGHESAHAALVSEARQVIGERGADTVKALLRNAQKPASGIFASLIAFITLLFGASGVFTELRDALNIMWDALKQETSGFMDTIKQHLFSFGTVLSVGFLLLISLIISSWLTYLGHAFNGLLPLLAFVLQIVNLVLAFGVETALFALMFRYVASVHIAWREVIVGAVGTALLFTAGKYLLGIYLAKASVGSTYGAAGSLVAVVV
jgi:membrane protein